LVALERAKLKEKGFNKLTRAEFARFQSTDLGRFAILDISAAFTDYWHTITKTPICYENTMQTTALGIKSKYLSDTIVNF